MKITNSIKTRKDNYLILTDEVFWYWHDGESLSCKTGAYMDSNGEFIRCAYEFEFNIIANQVEMERVDVDIPVPLFSIEVETDWVMDGVLQDNGRTEHPHDFLRVYNVEGKLIHEEKID